MIVWLSIGGIAFIGVIIGLFYYVRYLIGQLRIHKTNLAQHTLLKQMVHDLSSPLATMQTVVQFLEESMPSEKESGALKSSLRLMWQSCQRMESVLLQSLDKKARQPERFSLHHLLDVLVKEFRNQPLGDKVEFQRKYYPTNLYLLGNRHNLERALGNIMKNGLESMRTRSKQRLVLATTRNKGRVVIEIADSGRGMNDTVKHKILAPKGHTYGKANGHGLGMRVVREVLDEWGGQISIDSKLGKGSVFTLRLPAP
jgi:signal transduction histidine kinase